MKTYKGTRSNGELIVSVTVDSNPPVTKTLTPYKSLKLFNHSPTGFECGYGGSGPAQLALALLLDVTNSPDLAVKDHQALKWDLVFRLPQKVEWEITSQEIEHWLLAAEKQCQLWRAKFDGAKV